MLKYLKYLVKKHFYHLLLKNKFSPSVQVSQALLQAELRKIPFNFSDIEFNVFTYHGEDGLLFNILSRIPGISKTFVDVGAGDCVKGNCANLVVNLGWRGLFIDAGKKNMAIGKSFYSKLPLTKFDTPKYTCASVTPQNINQLISAQNITGNIGLLSIDIDGNDYWIWKAIDVINPAVVIIEAKIEYGTNNIIVPYSDNNSNQKNKFYSGASVAALYNLAAKKGYSPVSCNRYGYNLIFVKNNYLATAGIPPLPIETVLHLPNATESFLPDSFFKDKIFVKED